MYTTWLPAILEGWCWNQIEKGREEYHTNIEKGEQMSSMIWKVSEGKGKFVEEEKRSSKEIKLIKSNNVTDASKEDLHELQKRFNEKFK